MQKYSNSKKRIKVLSFMNEVIDDYRIREKIGTALNYSKALKSFSTFLNNRDIPFSSFDRLLIEKYERWLLSKEMIRNSTSFYMRNLRALYNKAVSAGIARDTTPFVNVYTGVDKTRKRAIGEQLLQKIVQIDLSNSQSLSLSRDLFLFSYCTRGMSFVDIAFLKKTDITGGVISYVRQKTGHRIQVKILPCVQAIIRKYQETTVNSRYVFPIITSDKKDEAFHQYLSALSYHNRKLKKIGDMIGLQISLTSYTARHSWATAAHKCNVPISMISEALGHSSEKVTRIYLEDLDTSIIDKMNERIINKCIGNCKAVV